MAKRKRTGSSAATAAPGRAASASAGGAPGPGGDVDVDLLELAFGPDAQRLPRTFFGPMRASSPSEPAAILRARLEEDGYLLVRGLHDASVVKAAASSLLGRLAAKGLIVDDARRGSAAGVHSGKATTAGSREHLDMQDDPHFCRMFEDGSRAQVFLSGLLEGDAHPFAFKFLRCVPPGAGTPVHCDNVYMGRGTGDLLTCWTPVTPVGYEHGSLCLCANSHRAGGGFRKLRATYGRLDVDRDRVQGSLSSDAREFTTGPYSDGAWITAEFAQGDAVVFGMHLLHGSLTNVSDAFRISCDTRWQRRTDVMDER